VLGKLKDKLVNDRAFSKKIRGIGGVVGLLIMGLYYSGVISKELLTLIILIAGFCSCVFLLIFRDEVSKVFVELSKRLRR
jgi:uncharacterized membrane protein YccC